jgi:two-component system chemotaxis response regulator CheY
MCKYVARSAAAVTRENVAISLSINRQPLTSKTASRLSLQQRRCPRSLWRADRGFDRKKVSMSVNLAMPVLVVEDSETTGKIIRNLLMLAGFKHVDAASGGTTALARLGEKEYGLVISDWNMQPMSGYELLKEIRADPARKELPFIMVTAQSTTANVTAAKEAGVNDYIVKPFTAETLKRKIAAVCGSRGMSLLTEAAN